MILPLFPLKSIFYPGETVPLHIFEDRYKELINDCRAEAITFGIPVVFKNTLMYGTEVQLVEVVNTYPEGEMDVVCVARQVFQLVSFQSNLNNKSYAGGEVVFLESDNDAPISFRRKVYAKIADLYKLMNVEFPNIDFEKFNSYAFAHKMGLSYEQEYDLLQLTNETRRLQYLEQHLDRTVQTLTEIDRTKHLIELNGHFKNFDPLDFKELEL